LAEGYRLGANSYVQKPVDFEAFQKLMKEVGSYWLAVNQISPGAIAHQGERAD
jgi:two-component system response regulator